MGDCQSYFGTTNVECQKYSLSCNWDKKLYTCTSSNVCSQYDGEGQQTQCESVTKQNGDKWCKFDTKENKCSTKQCSDYEKTTDADCAASLQDDPNQLQCKSNNKTCQDPLESCSKYTVADCLQRKGNNGSCILTSGQNPICRDPSCEDIAEITDDACKKKNPSCLFTNGAYCVLSLADKCDSQTTNCNSIFTKEGKCKSTNTSKCALDDCTNLSKTTNEECGKYKGTTDQNLCITNGVFCVKSLTQYCSDIKISEGSSCEQYISKEGMCKFKEGSKSICELSSCNTQMFSSDEVCKKYSSQGIAPATICITNGVKCVDNLNTCDSYLKVEKCLTLKGSDGQCMDDSTQGSTKCTTATCDKISSPSAITCPAGNKICKFDGVNCVKELKTCENYTSDCDKMISSNAKPCTTNQSDSTKCVTKTCATAPTNESTNEDCIKYLVGCLTTGQGCTTQLSNCESYKGIKSTCEKYIGADGKCTAKDTNKADDLCKPKDCADATSVTNDQQCNTYSNLCFYSSKIQKCSKKVATCNNIQPKSQVECESVLTSESSVYCAWNGSDCVQATCNTVQYVKSKEVCAVYGANCEFDNISGCKDKTNYTCSSLRSASICLQDSASNACVWDSTNNTCIQFNKCSDYPLTPAKENEVKTVEDILKDTETCKLLSNKCYSNGGKTCIAKTPCSVISDEKNCIGSIGIDDKICGYDAKAAACKSFGQCSDVELLQFSFENY